MSREGPDYRTAAEYYADKAREERWQRTHGEWAPDLPPCLLINGKKVHVEHVYPPIPIRTMDWRATCDGYQPGDPMGYGSTRLAALQDLQEQCDERED